MAQARMLYEDGRPYTVPDSLEELTGPISGVVELPLRLDWSEQGRYDLSDERQRNLMYERVIRESMRVEDLRTFVHGPTLARVWRQLWLPRKVRTLWESRFPSSAFEPYKLTADQVDALHVRLLAWADEVEAASQ